MKKSVSFVEEIMNEEKRPSISSRGDGIAIKRSLAMMSELYENEEKED